MIQFIFNALMRCPTSSLPKLTGYKVLLKLYRMLTRTCNQLVIYAVDGREIFFPASHGLPFEWKFDPENSKCLGRVAAACARKYPASVMIDVGANVGDSAAIIRSSGVSNKIVCVEGVKEFFDVLTKNAKILGDVVPVHRFVGPSACTSACKLRVLKIGNAAIYDKPEYYIESANAEQVNVTFTTINNIAETYAPGGTVKLLKTDIEGFDLPVLNGSLDFIAAHRPVIFLELHVRDIDEKSKGVSWKDLWDNLAELGYRKALYWYCSNDFLCMLDISEDLRITEDIHDYLRNRSGRLYVDVCVLHEADADLAALLYQTEKTHARQVRAE